MNTRDNPNVGFPRKLLAARVRGSSELYFCLMDGLNLIVGSWVIVETDLSEIIGRIVIAPDEMTRKQDELGKVFSGRTMTEADLERLRTQDDLAFRMGEWCTAFAMDRGWSVPVAVQAFSLAGDFQLSVNSSLSSPEIEGLRTSLVESFGVCVKVRVIDTSPGIRLIGGLGKSTYSANQKSIIPSVEDARYAEIKQRMPQLGQRVRTVNGHGMVISMNVFDGVVTVRLEDGSDEEQLHATELLPSIEER